MTRCRNCDSLVEANFCPQCGQKNIDLERPLVELLGEVVRETFDLDGRALRTLNTLLRRPGVLTREFLSGHRQKYSPPFRLYLVISVLFFFVATWFAGRGVLLEQGQDAASFAPGQEKFFGEELPRLMFLLMPVFALLMKLAHRGRLYFDHLIFSVHIHSAAYVALGFMLPFEQLASTNVAALVAQVLLLGYLVTYFLLAVREVYRSGWIAAGLKSLGVLLAYLMILSATIEAASSLSILAD